MVLGSPRIILFIRKRDAFFQFIAPGLLLNWKEITYSYKNRLDISGYRCSCHSSKQVFNSSFDWSLFCPRQTCCLIMNIKKRNTDSRYKLITKSNLNTVWCGEAEATNEGITLFDLFISIHMLVLADVIDTCTQNTFHEFITKESLILLRNNPIYITWVPDIWPISHQKQWVPVVIH